MEVKVQKLPASRWEITVTLPWEEWQTHREHAVEHLAANVNMAGFRQGKVPEAMLEQRFGKEAILIETAEHAVHHTYPQALLEAKAEAIGRPEIKFDAVKADEPLVFTITTDVLPEIVLREWRKDVAKINAAAAEKHISVTDEEMNKELAELAKMRASFVPVDRAAALSDTAKVDFTVTVDGVIIEGGTSTDHAIVLGSGAFIPGFEDQIIGLTSGEEKTFELTFPAEYHAKHLAGKPATFAVKLKSVEEQKIPAIDDAFAQTIGKFESLAAVKENMQKGMLEEKQRAAKEEQRTLILDALIAAADMEYPVVLVEEEAKRMLLQFRSQVESMGFEWEKYLTETKKSEAELGLEWEPQAKKRVAAELVLQKLAADESIDVDTEAVEAEMNKVFQYYKNTKQIEEKIDMGKLYTSVRGQMVNEKVLTWLEGIR
ncbi:MAG: trigger factor [Candidatus Moraniibacteriota bacterium]|nr:MAG: trigger factor [Candidatus Moranbacteria bacterium]